MVVSKAQQKAVNKYIAKSYDRLNITIPKGRKLTLDVFCREHGESSVNGLVNRLLRAEMGLSEDEWKQVEETESDG